MYSNINKLDNLARTLSPRNVHDFLTNVVLILFIITFIIAASLLANIAYRQWNGTYDIFGDKCATDVSAPPQIQSDDVSNQLLDLATWQEYLERRQLLAETLQQLQDDPVTETLETVAYKVQPGDTLTHIASKFDVSIDELLKNNPAVTDPNLIIVDQLLAIP